MKTTLILPLALSVLSACATTVEAPPPADPVPMLDRFPALSSSPLEPGSYLVAFNVSPSDWLFDEAVRLDVGAGDVALAAPWSGLRSYSLRDADPDSFELPHDVAPAWCDDCEAVGWTPSGSRVRVELAGLEGFRVRHGVLYYDRGRAHAVVHETQAGVWSARTVSFELLRDEVAPELRLGPATGPLLPWSSFSVEASEPLRSSELALRIHDGTFADISSGLLDARHAYVSPDMTSPDRHWWNLGSIVRVDYRGGAVDDAGNALTAGTWTAPIVPSIPTRDIGGTGGLVHWGALDFARGTHTHLAGEGLGFFGMVDPGNTVTTVSARISLCGPPDTRVRCTSVWSYPDQVPRSSSTVMYPDGLQTAEGCSAPQQVITLGQVTGETIVGPIGVAATFDHEDGSPLDDVAVVVHSIWADNNWAGGGS